MDGPFYVDLKPPHNATSGSSVTLTTSLQALASAGQMPLFPVNYFGYPGKAVRVTCLGQCTSAATPVAFNFNMIWGTTPGVGANLCGVNVTWTANNANTTFIFKCIIRCRTTGLSGSVLGTGWLFIQNTGIIPAPATGLGVTTGIDLVTAQYLCPSLSRGGSTVETAQLHDVFYEALN